VEKDPANPGSTEGTMTAHAIDETNARLAARLNQLLITPGISDKDRKLVEQNLKRLRAAISRE
jgi:hypothetical protein